MHFAYTIYDVRTNVRIAFRFPFAKKACVSVCVLWFFDFALQNYFPSYLIFILTETKKKYYPTLSYFCFIHYLSVSLILIILSHSDFKKFCSEFKKIQS